jgi:hypothetical protein
MHNLISVVLHLFMGTPFLLIVKSVYLVLTTEAADPVMKNTTVPYLAIAKLHTSQLFCPRTVSKSILFRFFHITSITGGLHSRSCAVVDLHHEKIKRISPNKIPNFAVKGSRINNANNECVTC